jgi:hypothetical protein
MLDQTTLVSTSTIAGHPWLFKLILKERPQSFATLRMQVHPWGVLLRLQGRRTSSPVTEQLRLAVLLGSAMIGCVPGATPFDYAFLGIARLVQTAYGYSRTKLPKTKTMAHAEAKRNRDRWEADLLLNVVFAHMAFSSTKDRGGRKMAHDRFSDAVHELYQFVTRETFEEDATKTV